MPGKPTPAAPLVHSAAHRAISTRVALAHAARPCCAGVFGYVRSGLAGTGALMGWYVSRIGWSPPPPLVLQCSCRLARGWMGIFSLGCPLGFVGRWSAAFELFLIFVHGQKRPEIGRVFRIPVSIVRGAIPRSWSQPEDVRSQEKKKRNGSALNVQPRLRGDPDRGFQYQNSQSRLGGREI